MGEEVVCAQALENGKNENNEEESRMELKRDYNQCIADTVDNNTEPDQSPNKKQVKEASNDEVCSEVTNPNTSAAENGLTTFHDISSQPSESANIVECGELTSTCLENSSSSEETLNTDDPKKNKNSNTSQNDNKDTNSAAAMSCVVMEIPKHASSSGVRKITFKFSKKKEDYDEEYLAKADLDHNSELYESSGGMGYVGAGDMDFYAARNMELKMSKKVVPNYYPTNVKKLLSTGILDGAVVKYMYNPMKVELRGIIGGGGYLCSCSLCNYSRVLSAYEFEQHAGAKTRHPNNHIYLENGKPIYSIIQEIKIAPLNILDEVIKNVAGSSVNEECFQAWKESLLQSNGRVKTYKDNSTKHTGMPHKHISQSVESVCLLSSLHVPSHFEQQMYVQQTADGWKHAVKKSSCPGVQLKRNVDGCTKRRDNDLHKLLFMPNGLPDGADLAYYVKGQKLLGGYKQGNGIVCGCCDLEISPSQFEAHAGMAARRQPYRHIYTSNGLTLHDIALSLASGQNLTTGDSDDMCAICGDGGDLILCNGCPRAFHAACLGFDSAPESSWHCLNCRDNVGNGRESSMARPIMIRLTQVDKAPEFEMGGCIVCRKHDFSVAKFDERTVIICDQCEKEYHVGCLRDIGLCELEELPKDKWFCCDDCNQIYVALQNSVSAGADIIPTSLSELIIKKHQERGLCTYEGTNGIQWRILSGKSRYPEHLPLLSRAAAIFRECFDPIVALSGRDLIPVMVYGRNISGQEFGGMYCVVLIVNSVVVSAGLLRIFGCNVAELPLVATSREYQGKGYFQVLFSCIERLLSSLNVEKLVLPAAGDAESIWTKKLGFRKMSEDQLSKHLREVQLTLFNKTSMLEKTVQPAIE
ncbi:putative histone acetyltransferase chromatin regulator PHD family [Lupinus albus]|uniref:Putative histone acetyltransferase chromatin regulator PHD family n=1 Tax=Lupinus albus TaxID=3870 RepID=A0A6A4R138_LUPAL|nr:putative histone acetyltransferase chromatin regulator PHD family [Lupinus albus]